MLTDKELKAICARTKTMYSWRDWVGLIREARKQELDYVVECGIRLNLYYYFGCMARNAHNHWSGSYEYPGEQDILLLSKNLAASFGCPETPDDEKYRRNIYDDVIDLFEA